MCGDQSPDAGLGEQCRTHFSHDRDHRVFEFSTFDGQLLDPRGSAAQGQLRCRVLWIDGGVRAQAHTSVDELAPGEAAEFLTKFDRCGDDKGLEHVDGCDTGEFCAIAGDDKGSQSLS